MVTLISIVENFSKIQAIVRKLGDFSLNVLQIIFLDVFCLHGSGFVEFTFWQFFSSYIFLLYI